MTRVCYPSAVRAYLFAALTACLGCGPPAAFECVRDEQCGAGGTCQPNGLCSFYDSRCEFNQRYGEHGGQFAGHCVSHAAQSSTSTAGISTAASVATTMVDSGLPSGASSTGSATAPSDSTSGAPEASTGSTLDPDLILWLPLDGAVQEPLVDASVFAHMGTCAPGGPAPSTGLGGGSGEFDGNDDALAFPHHEVFATPDGFTLSLWMRLPSAPADHRSLLAKPVGAEVADTWELFFLAGTLRFKLQGEDSSASITIPPPYAVDEWIHIASTWDGSTAAAYYQGTLVDTIGVPTIQVDDHPILVGLDQDNGTPAGFFAGDLDEIRIYQRALDTAEITALSNAR